MAKGNKKLLILVALVVLWYWYTNNSATPAVRTTTTGTTGTTGTYRRAPMMRSRYTAPTAVTSAADVPTNGAFSELAAWDANSANAAVNTFDDTVLQNMYTFLTRIPDAFSDNSVTALQTAWSNFLTGVNTMKGDVNDVLGKGRIIGMDNINIQALKNELNAARAEVVNQMTQAGVYMLPVPTTTAAQTRLAAEGNTGFEDPSASSAYRRRSRYVGMPVSSAGAYGLSGQRMGLSGYSSNMLSGANPFIPKSSTGANTRRGSLYDIRSQPNVMAPGDPLRGYLTNVNPFKQGI